MTFLKKAKVKAFTLVEMLVVLLIISVLLLLFVPNLTKQKEAVNDKGKAAVVKVVESQAELYSLDKNEDASLSKLQADGRITEEQAKAYKEYHAKQNTSPKTKRLSSMVKALICNGLTGILFSMVFFISFSLFFCDSPICL